MNTNACPCCGGEITQEQHEEITLLLKIVEMWNVLACPAGFARVTKVTKARARTLKAAIKERPHLTEWIRAMKAYVADTKRWPDRTMYGFDTFIRPSQRDKWFDAAPATDTTTMTPDQADAHYTKDMR